MRKLTATEFEATIKAATLKPRFKRELKFTTSTESFSDAAWQQRELLPIWNKSKNGGVLLVQPDETLYVVAFDDSNRTGDAMGRIKPIICDFCFTWQPGKEGGFVTFYPEKSDDTSVSLLCCADFDCSRNARGSTQAAKRSRAQIREQLTDEARIERLRAKLTTFIEHYNLQPIN